MFTWRWRFRAVEDRLTRARVALEQAQTNEATLLRLLAREKAEVVRLTNVIIHMKQENFTIHPQHEDDRWEGGKYVMEEEMEKSPPAPMEESEVAARQDAEINAMIEADLQRVFKD